MNKRLNNSLTLSDIRVLIEEAQRYVIQGENDKAAFVLLLVSAQSRDLSVSICDKPVD